MNLRRYQPLGLVLATTGVSITLLLSSVEASATIERCEALFQSPAQPTTLPAIDFTTLNEPSREYIRRLWYLVGERRLLSAEVYTRLLASEKPISPVAGRSTNVTLLPHQTAFNILLQEDLDWERIRNAIETLAQSAGQERSRKQTAQNDTEQVLMPIPIRSYSFPVQKSVRTGQGQVLGLNSAIDSDTQTSLIQAYDLFSGQRVSETIYDGYIEGIGDICSYGDLALLSFPVFSTRQILTVDLLAGKKLSDPVASRSSIMAKTHFVAIDGQPRVVTFSRNQAIVVNPFKGTVAPKMTIHENPEYTVTETFKVGESILFSSMQGGSFLFNPRGWPPIMKNEQIRAVSGFMFQGQPYGFGVVQPDGNVANSPEKELRTVNFATGELFKPIPFKTRTTSLPRVLAQFEQDGTVYAIVHTDVSDYVMDLINGEIKQDIGKVLGKSGASLNLLRLGGETRTFQFKGKTYVPAIYRRPIPNEPAHLVLLDAVTLELQGPGTPVDKEVERLEVISPNDRDYYAIVTFKDQSSQLLSLAAPLAGGPRH